MQLARQWFSLLSTCPQPSILSYGNRLGADQTEGDLDLARIRLYGFIAPSSAVGVARTRVELEAKA